MPVDLSSIPMNARRAIEAELALRIYTAASARCGHAAALDILNAAIDEAAHEAGCAFADKAPGGQPSLEHFAKVLDMWQAGGALDIADIEREPETLSFTVTRCGYMEMYRDMGIPAELHATLSFVATRPLPQDIRPSSSWSGRRTFPRALPPASSASAGSPDSALPLLAEFWHKPCPGSTTSTTWRLAMTEKKLITSGSKWEPLLGYSRAVVAGNTIYVSGTCGVEADGSVAPDMYGQAKRALEIIKAALGQANAEMKDVVRTRIFVTDASKFDEIAKAHGEVFGEIRPATTIVEVARLVDACFLVEIEAVAVL